MRIRITSRAACSGTVTRSRKPPSGAGPGLDAAGEQFGALAQAGEPVARRLGGGRPRAVVDDLGARARQARLHLDPAARRAAVADDVRRALAHRPGEQRLDVGRQRHVGTLQVGVDARRQQRHPRALELVDERRPAVAADRLAHLAERLARDVLDVRDVRGRFAGSAAPIRSASSAFSAMTDRLWPTRSCRSRAKRRRSSATASRATSPRAARRSALSSISRRKANIMKPIASVVAVSESVEPASARSTTFVTAVNAVATRDPDDRRAPRQAHRAGDPREEEQQRPALVVGERHHRGDRASARRAGAILRASASGGRSNGVQL